MNHVCTLECNQLLYIISMLTDCMKHIPQLNEALIAQYDWDFDTLHNSDKCYDQIYAQYCATSTLKWTVQAQVNFYW